MRQLRLGARHDTVSLRDLVFSGWSFAVLALSTYLSRNECPRGSGAVASAPCPTEPRMHSYLKPLWGHPFSLPTLLPRVLKKKKEKKHFPISRCERKCLPRSSRALRPVLCHWTVPPGSSPRVGLLGPAEIKMELVKENVKKKKSQK